MVITKTAVSDFPRVELMPKKQIFLDFKTAKDTKRLNSSHFSNVLLHRVVSPSVICGHLDPEDPDLYERYCKDLFEAIADQPFVFLPESNFPAVIVKAINETWIRDLRGIVRRPTRKLR